MLEIDLLSFLFSREARILYGEKAIAFRGALLYDKNKASNHLWGIKKMNSKNIKQTLTAVIVSALLGYILIATKDMITRVVVIPFFIFATGLLAKNICLAVNRKKAAKIFEIVCVTAFFIYYFGFLIYWDLISATNKDYVSLAFSRLPWLGGCFVLYRRIKKYKNEKK